MLERINGDEKGDAIVSVRGYEPIWSRFTPSYKLKSVYFKAGRAEAGKREAVLFDKSEYVFDITGGKALSERDKMLDVLEKEENAKSGDDGSDKERLASLDKKWLDIENEVRDRLKKVVPILDEEDAAAVKKAPSKTKSHFCLRSQPVMRRA